MDFLHCMIYFTIIYKFTHSFILIYKMFDFGALVKLSKESHGGRVLIIDKNNNFLAMKLVCFSFIIKLYCMYLKVKELFYNIFIQL